MLDGTASATAQGVAAQRLTFRRIPADHGRPDDDQRLQADVAAGIELADHPLARYLQARTLFFDQVVVDAIAAGTTQLVAVGAGYDGRSLRYAKPGVRWFELDHPATQADKQARLERLGVPLDGLTFAPADFTTDDVESCLAATGHDPAQPTLFTSEGVVGLRPARRAARAARGAAPHGRAGQQLRHRGAARARGRGRAGAPRPHRGPGRRHRRAARVGRPAWGAAAVPGLGRLDGALGGRPPGRRHRREPAQHRLRHRHRLTRRRRRPARPGLLLDELDEGAEAGLRVDERHGGAA